MVVDFTEYRLTRQLRSASTPSRSMPPGSATARDTVLVLPWRKVSSSAYLMVDPRNGARAVIRDTGLGAGRYVWSVLSASEMEPMAQGRASDLEQARSIAAAALRACAGSGVGGTGR
jgi:hypothetical protein